MVQLELPHLNVLTKCDLADRAEVWWIDIEEVLQPHMDGDVLFPGKQGSPGNRQWLTLGH